MVIWKLVSLHRLLTELAPAQRPIDYQPYPVVFAFMDACTEVEYFEYRPIDLEGPSFRLLRLLKGDGTNIECELFQAWHDGDNAFTYEALSYTWGDITRSSSIIVNGKTLQVTENLHIALQHLVLPDTDRILWIDAICIDQDNDRERGHQVQQMAKTYAHAERVIIWLGPATEDTDSAMSALKLLEKRSRQPGCSSWRQRDTRWIHLWEGMQNSRTNFLEGEVEDPEPQQRAGIIDLLNRSWFDRVWVLQEAANAKRASICCGTKSVSARIFALAPLVMIVPVPEHCQSVLDIMPGSFRADSWWAEKRDLYNLLQKFKGSKATDPRDKIYALLNMSSDANDTNVLRADYTKDYQQVLNNTAQFLFGRTNVPETNLTDLLAFSPLINTENLTKLLAGADAQTVLKFISERGDDIKFTRQMLLDAVRNENLGQDVTLSIAKHLAHNGGLLSSADLAVRSSDAVLQRMIDHTGDFMARTIIEKEMWKADHPQVAEVCLLGVMGKLLAAIRSHRLRSRYWQAMHSGPHDVYVVMLHEVRILKNILGDAETYTPRDQPTDDEGVLVPQNLQDLEQWNLDRAFGGSRNAEDVFRELRRWRTTGLKINQSVILPATIQYANTSSLALYISQHKGPAETAGIVAKLFQLFGLEIIIHGALVRAILSNRVCADSVVKVMTWGKGIVISLAQMPRDHGEIYASNDKWMHRSQLVMQRWPRIPLRTRMMQAGQ